MKFMLKIKNSTCGEINLPTMKEPRVPLLLFAVAKTNFYCVKFGNFKYLFTIFLPLLHNKRIK